MLNRSKGPAVWVRVPDRASFPILKYDLQGPRAQMDRRLYKQHIQETLNNYPNLEIRAGSVHDLIFDHTLTDGTWGTVTGVRLGTYSADLFSRLPRLSAQHRIRRGCALLPGRYLHGHLPLRRDPHRYAYVSCGPHRRRLCCRTLGLASRRGISAGPPPDRHTCTAARVVH
jgi:hypothetical protein